MRAAWLITPGHKTSGPSRAGAYGRLRGANGLYVRLASPSLSLVKIMRITGLDRRFLAFQVPEQAAGLRLP
jgi:hypothetical protein